MIKYTANKNIKGDTKIQIHQIYANIISNSCSTFSTNELPILQQEQICNMKHFQFQHYISILSSITPGKERLYVNRKHSWYLPYYVRKTSSLQYLVNIYILTTNYQKDCDPFHKVPYAQVGILNISRHT